jgi:hypothetical protein
VGPHLLNIFNVVVFQVVQGLTIQIGKWLTQSTNLATSKFQLPGVGADLINYALWVWLFNNN